MPLRPVLIEKVIIENLDFHQTRQRHISKCRSFQGPEKFFGDETWNLFQHRSGVPIGDGIDSVFHHRLFTSFRGSKLLKPQDIDVQYLRANQTTVQ